MTQSQDDDNASLPAEEPNPDHHIWNNNGTWWCHYSVRLPGEPAKRMRISLRTHSVEVARMRRDTLLAALGQRKEESL